jgi:uncharacterized protein (TIGR03067 family)
MKLPFLLIAVSTLLTAAVGFAAELPAEDDLARLQGTWLTVSLVSDGKILVDEKTPARPGPVTKLVYEGHAWTIVVGDKTAATGTFKIVQSKSPKEIDILDQSGRPDKTKLGIYEIHGDSYRYCLSPAGKPRPTQFVSKKGTGDSLGVSKREKP